MLDPATDVDFIAGTSISVANVSGCQYFSCQRLWLQIRPLPVSQAASTSVASVSGCQCLNCQCLSLQVSVASLYGCHYQLPVSLAASTSVASVSAGGYLICQCLGWLVPQLPSASASVAGISGSVASASASVAGTSGSVASVSAGCT